ncbi:amino acid ABC transporter substrate-binding protein, PAAT family [Pelagirhabdus alkalitolerans]|uniref:Amino acid ABC transporter substrate-binding protein, PAAT family n=1 Tax=Pelagirhabdus alkalitolerans TaxID=1612202 RepID=A0A1G6MSA8_9BACI|nr:transporter substrate-binding domain-containing protein [Pelagirhabdus alkalitolerans]SDC58439.1 amino acid ABC transporter substrate-binding protein, PAAT family [Pelagirhabdus alkalitolerans]
MKKWLSLFLFMSILLIGVIGCTLDNDESPADTDADTDQTEETEDETIEDESTDSSWSDIEEEGTLVVGTSGTYSPVTYFNDENELTGFDVELVREIADYLDLEVEFETMDFDGILPALRNGQIDLAVNDFAITEERLETFTFTDPYKFSYGSIIVREDDVDQFDDAYDLEDVPVALGSLTSNYARFSEYVGADGVAYDGGTEAILRDILNGNQDAYLNDRLVLAQIIEDFGDDNLVVADQVKYHPTTSAIPVLKGNDALAEQLSVAINALREDGTVAELSEEFLGADASEPIDSDDVVEFDF